MSIPVSVARIAVAALRAGSRSTGASFAAAVVGNTDALLEERYELFKAGLSPVDWGMMTKWQRRDLLLRHRLEAKGHAVRIKKDGLGGALGAILQRVLGV